MEEIWVPVKNFEGLYEISNKMRIRSVSREVENLTPNMRKTKSKVLTPWSNKCSRKIYIRLRRHAIVYNKEVNELYRLHFPSGSLVVSQD